MQRTTTNYPSIITTTFFYALLPIMITLSAPGYCAEADDENLVNWYYAHEFGTGAYKVGDTTVEIFHIPISYTIRPKKNGSWGIKFIMPFTIGYHNFKYEKTIGM